MASVKKRKNFTGRFVIIILGFLLVFLVPVAYVLYATNQVTTEAPEQEDNMQVITLSENETRYIHNREIRVILKKLSFPEIECRDCISSAEVEVKKDGETKKLVFQMGGIMGDLPEIQDGFGYRFTLEEMDNETVTLTYSKI